jgi:fatty acid desaturase
MQVLADEWGFSSIGTSFPAGVNPQVLMRAIPEELLEVDRGRAVMGLVAPALLMASGLCCAVLAAGSAAWWQRIACWVITGTGYAGLFSLAHEAARDTLLPEHPVTQDLLGTLIMAPSLFAFEPWKLRAFAHFNQVWMGMGWCWNGCVSADGDPK